VTLDKPEKICYSESKMSRHRGFKPELIVVYDAINLTGQMKDM